MTKRLILYSTEHKSWNNSYGDTHDVELHNITEVVGGMVGAIYYNHIAQITMPQINKIEYVIYDNDNCWLMSEVVKYIGLNQYEGYNDILLTHYKKRLRGDKLDQLI